MLISIITPALNCEKFIEFCIRNIIGQAYRDVEHIIMDGGSTDSTVSVIQSYANSHPHIRWSSQVDRGQSDAMNRGIAMAKGDIIGILNADDYYEPGVLLRVADIFKTLPKPSLLVGNCNVWNDDGQLLYVSTPSKISLTNILLGRFLDAFPMNPSAYFYHASLHDIIGQYKIDEHFGMDLDFIIRAVQHANVAYRNELWGNYRYLFGTKTHSDVREGNNPRRVMAIVDEHLRRLPLHLRYAIYLRRMLTRGAGLLKKDVRITAAV